MTRKRPNAGGQRLDTISYFVSCQKTRHSSGLLLRFFYKFYTIAFHHIPLFLTTNGFLQGVLLTCEDETVLLNLWMVP